MRRNHGFERHGKRGRRIWMWVPQRRQGVLGDRCKIRSATARSLVDLVRMVNEQHLLERMGRLIRPGHPVTDEARALRNRDLVKEDGKVATAWKTYYFDATRKQSEKAVTDLRNWLVSMNCEPTLAAVSPRIAAAYAMSLLAGGNGKRNIDDRKLAPLSKHWEMVRAVGAVDFNPWTAVRELLKSGHLGAKRAGEE